MTDLIVSKNIIIEKCADFIQNFDDFCEAYLSTDPEFDGLAHGLGEYFDLDFEESMLKAEFIIVKERFDAGFAYAMNVVTAILNNETIKRIIGIGEGLKYYNRMSGDAEIVLKQFDALIENAKEEDREMEEQFFASTYGNMSNAFESFKHDFLQICEEYSVKDESLIEKAEAFKDESLFVPSKDINVKRIAAELCPDLEIHSYSQLLEVCRNLVMLALDEAMDIVDKLCNDYLDGKYNDDDHMKSIRDNYNAIYNGYTHLISGNSLDTKFYEAPRFKKADPSLDY